MARNSGTVQPPLTEQDLDYARDLLLWVRSLDPSVKNLTWEQWELQQLEKRENSGT